MRRSDRPCATAWNGSRRQGILCEISNPEVTRRCDRGHPERPPRSRSRKRVERVIGGGPPLSPDGAWLAGLGRRGDILVLPLAGGELRRLAGESARLEMVPAGWTEDGRHLFVHPVGEVPANVQKLDVSTGRLEPWRQLTLQDLAGINRIGPVKVAPDGVSWAFGYVRVLSNLYVVEGLK